VTLKEELAERIIAVAGTRCPECDYEASAERPHPHPAELKRSIEEEWAANGIGAWIEWDWPKRFPAWLVRAGFHCPYCGAEPLLLTLEADAHNG